ncbi:MAG: hypothetical protein QOF04_1872 [Solirubrobacteraceae bacterium]|nr:hypothetical protein [Solirubrobacteraceae bacterium]
MRRRAARTLAAVAALAAGAAGCGGGGGDDGADVLRQTSANLAKVTSGDLTLRFVMRPQEGGDDQGVGVELRGPFSLAGDGPLPVARVAYTQIAGGRRLPATFISTGRAAFVEVGGTTYRVPASRTKGVRFGRRGRGLDALQLDARRWVRAPKVSDGPIVGGEATDRVTGDLNTGPALADLLGAAQRAGGGGGLTAQDGRRLAQTVRRSSIEVLTGTKDRLLRRMRVRADLDVPESLRRQAGGRAALHLEFELGVARPNRAVTVTAPKDARPLPKRAG